MLRHQAERSDYTYHFSQHDGVSVLVIIDQNRGGTTVTNNVKAVVQAIAAQVGAGILNAPIIYRDSDQIFDGIDGACLDEPFYAIRATEEKETVIAAVERFRTAKAGKIGQRVKAAAPIPTGPWGPPIPKDTPGTIIGLQKGYLEVAWDIYQDPGISLYKSWINAKDHQLFIEPL